MFAKSPLASRHRTCSHRIRLVAYFHAAMPRKVLCVAEKNSAAKEITNVLCRHTGQSPHRAGGGRNPVFKFPLSIEGQASDVMFTAVAGHLKAQEIEPKYAWGKCAHRDVLDPSKARIKSFVHEDKRELAAQLRLLSRSADMLVLWLDCDSEGEKIAQDVADVCLEEKASLLVRRARFSAMTLPDIMGALQSLGSIDSRVVSMVSVRQELDLRAGAAYTRFITERARVFDIPPNGGRDRVLVSYGPCQSPTLGLVVDRYLTIKHFNKRPFWVIQMTLENCDVQFHWVRGRIFEQYTASILYRLCCEDAMASEECARVERVEKKIRHRYRPTPLSTVELQKAASRLLRISSDATVKAAEALYANGLISYPRTETTRFDSSYDLHGFVEMQTGEGSAWGGFASRLLSPGTEQDPVCFTWPRDGGSDDKAHPPIHPIAPPPGGNFATNNERRVYEYIVRRFLACCSIDGRGAETQVEVRAGRAEVFGARGLIVQVRGYLEVMAPYEKWSDRSMPPQLLEQGAMVPIDELGLNRSETQPPPLLSEADLISLMDRHGIGTDATIAQHISTIQEREYVRLLGDGRFEPQPLGIALVEGLERSLIQLARPGMRKAQEEDFKKIQSGELSSDFVKGNALQQFRTTFARLESNASTVSSVFSSHFGAPGADSDRQNADVAGWPQSKPNFSTCGVCARKMTLKHTGGGNGSRKCALYCPHCKKSFMLSRNVQERVYTAVQGVGNLCAICKYQVINVRNGDRQHKLCPACFVSPPQDSSLNSEGKDGGDFRCFSCTHPTCANASGTPRNQQDVAKCPGRDCDRMCQIKKKTESNGRSSFRVACISARGSGDCDWTPYFFPHSAAQVEARGDDVPPCVQCGSKQLTVTWRRGAVPPGSRLTFEGCIWCSDDGYKDALAAVGEAAKFPRHPHPAAPNTVPPDVEGSGFGRGRVVRGRGRGRGNVVNHRQRGGARGRGQGYGHGRGYN